MRDSDAIWLTKPPTATVGEGAGRKALAAAAASLVFFAVAVTAAGAFRSPEPIAAAEPLAAAPPPSLPEPVPAREPGRHAQDALLLRFLSDRTDYSNTFSGAGPLPQAVCEALSRNGLETSAWAPSEIGGNGWECALGPLDSEGQPAKDDGRSSLFLLLRGSDAGRIDQMRLKVSLIQPGDCTPLLALSRRAVDLVGSFTGLAIPPQIKADLAARRSSTLALQFATFSVGAEYDDARRVNLLAQFHRQRPDADRFEPSLTKAQSQNANSVCDAAGALEP